MQRRDVITVAGISVIALVSALVLGPMFRAGEGEFAGPLPAPRTAVLPDPVRPPPVPPLLVVSLTDAATGAPINDGAILELFSGAGVEPVAGARGLRTEVPMQVQVGPLDTSLNLQVRRPRYLSPPGQPVTLVRGRTLALEFRLQPLHAVTVRPQGTSTGTLLGVVRTWPLPQWPEDRPVLRWAYRAEAGYEFQLPVGRYACCMPLVELSRDLHGRPWLTPHALASAPGFAVPGNCNWGEFEVSGPATMTPAMNAATGDESVSGTVYGHDGEPQSGLRVELVRLGPIREVCASRTADAEGRFKFTGLAPGTYQARPAETPGNWPWVEAAAEATVALTLPKAPEVEPGAAGSAKVQVVRRGEAIASSQLLLLGSYQGTDFVPAPPGQRVGRTAGYAGLVVWEGAPPGRHRVTAALVTAAVLEIEVRAGLTTTATLEISPLGTGDLRITGAARHIERVVIEDSTGGMYFGLEPDERGEFKAYGLQPGTWRCTILENDEIVPLVTVEIRADELATAKVPPRPAVPDTPPSPPENPKEQSKPEAAPPGAPKEEPKDEPAPEDGEDKKNAAANDRPADGVSLKLPAPSGSPTTPPLPPLPPTPAPVTPVSAPPRPAMPVLSEAPAGPVLRIVLDLNPAAPELWRAVIALGDQPALATLFENVATPTGRLWLGLSGQNGKPTLTLRGDFSQLREIAVVLPGHQPLKITIPQGAQEVQAKPQKR